MNSAGEDAASQAVANLALYQAAQRAGTERRVVAGLTQPLQGGGGDVQAQAAVLQTLSHALDLQAYDLTQVLS